MEKTATDYFNEYDELEKRSKEDLQSLFEVEQAIMTLQRQIIDLQARKKDLDISRSKAAYVVRQQQIDLRQLKSKGYKARNSGL